MQRRKPQVWLLEASPRNPATGATITVRLAGGGQHAYRYFGAQWLAGLDRPPIASSRLGYGEDDGVPVWGLESAAQAMQLVWAGGDRVLTIAEHFWPGAAFTLRSGPDGGADGDFTVRLTGKATDARVDTDGILSLALADPTAALAVPAVPDTFAGSGGAEGPVDLKDRLKRRAFGPVLNVDLWPLDPANNIWVATDPARPLQAISAVYDRGNAGTVGATIAWAGTVAATLAALAASSPPDGGFTRAPSIGAVKWWHSSPGLLTADLLGEIGGAYVDTAAQIAERIVTSRTAITFSTGHVATWAAARPGDAGILLDNPAETVSQALWRLLGPCTMWWHLDGDGKIALGEWSWGASAGNLSGGRVERTGTYRPMKKCVLGYRKNHRQMARGDIAAALLIDWETEVGGTGKPESGATRDEPGNLLPPASAQFEAAGWVVSDTGSVATAPVAAGSGWAEPPQARGLLFDLSASTAYQDATSLPVPVVAGGRVHVQFLYATKGIAVGALRCLLYYRDVNGDFVDSSDFDVPQVGGGTYALYGISDVVPEGAATVQPDIYKPAGTASGEYRFGKIFVTNTALNADVTSENNAGGLIAGAQILQNGAPAIQAGASPFEISVADGDVITFSPQLAVTPTASADLSGLPALASNESYSFRAETLTGTGCTVRVKKRTSGGTVSTLSTGAGSVITTDLEYQVSKGDSRDARDSKYKMRLTGDVRGVYQAGGGGGWFDSPFMLGGMTIEIFAKVSAAWQSCGVFTVSPPYGVTGTYSFDETFTFTCANAIGDPAGNEFRALVLSRAFPSTDKLTGLDSVTFQVDGTSVTETAVTQAVTMRVQPQNV